MPFNGTGFITVDKYLIRSQMSPEFTVGVDTRRKDLDCQLLRTLTEQWRQVSPCYSGDYYPLTAYGTGNTIWMAWQFDRPDLGAGFVQVLRRADCPEESVRQPLRGLDPEARYTLMDVDANQPWQASGQELFAQGLTVKSPSRPTAILISASALAREGPPAPGARAEPAISRRPP